MESKMQGRPFQAHAVKLHSILDTQLPIGWTRKIPSWQASAMDISISLPLQATGDTTYVEPPHGILCQTIEHTVNLHASISFIYAHFQLNTTLYIHASSHIAFISLLLLCPLHISVICSSIASPIVLPTELSSSPASNAYSLSNKSNQIIFPISI